MKLARTQVSQLFESHDPAPKSTDKDPVCDRCRLSPDGATRAQKDGVEAG